MPKRKEAKANTSQAIQGRLSDLRKQDIKGIFLADIHFSHRQPISRIEDDWYEAQERYGDALKALWQELGKPTVLCAGDVFHRWNAEGKMGLVSAVADWMPPFCSPLVGRHALGGSAHSWRFFVLDFFWRRFRGLMFVESCGV